MTRKETIEFLGGNRDAELFAQAEAVTERYCGQEVLIRGLVEFSSHCMRNCLYCGLRQDNRALKRYRMPPAAILERVARVAEQNIGTVVLQSGDDYFYTYGSLALLIKEIKKEWPDMAVTLSLGERPQKDYQVLRDSGADRYLLKHETFNARLYARLHPGQSLIRRLEILENLKKLGYQVGVGNIIGLPGQTIDDLAEDILFFRDFGPDMIGIGPFIPHRDTPLAQHGRPDMDLVLRFIALTRIVTRNAHIPATTALNTLDPGQGAVAALKAGANVIMANFTPENYRSQYQIYDDKNPSDYFRCLDIIFDAGKKVNLGRGDSLRKTFKSGTGSIKGNPTKV